MKEMNKKFLDLISECCSLLIEEYVSVYDMKKEVLKKAVNLVINEELEKERKLIYGKHE